MSSHSHTSEPYWYTTTTDNTLDYTTTGRIGNAGTTWVGSGGGGGAYSTFMDEKEERIKILEEKVAKLERINKAALKQLSALDSLKQ